MFEIDMDKLVKFPIYLQVRILSCANAFNRLQEACDGDSAEYEDKCRALAEEKLRLALSSFQAYKQSGAYIRNRINEEMAW